MGQLQGFSRFDKTEVEKLKPSNVVRYKGEMYGIVDEAARDVLESKQDKLVLGKGIKQEIHLDGTKLEVELIENHLISSEEVFPVEETNW